MRPSLVLVALLLLSSLIGVHMTDLNPDKHVRVSRKPTHHEAALDFKLGATQYYQRRNAVAVMVTTAITTVSCPTMATAPVMDAAHGSLARTL